MSPRVLRAFVVGAVAPLLLVSWSALSAPQPSDGPASAAGGEGRRYTSAVVPIFSKPFDGEYQTNGVFDHAPGDEHRQLTFWGTQTWGADGHKGWDWPMKIGTPLLAMADGEVILAEDQGTTKCGAGTVDSSVIVRIRHDAPDGNVYIASYGHLSKPLVKKGDRVKRGQQVALSGNSGCSSGPHLHLGVIKVTNPRRLTGYKMDPYGWDADRPDPMAAGGQPSVWLWRKGEAPLVYKDIPTRPEEDTTNLVITRMTGTAYADDRHPNNEFVELALSRSFKGDALPLKGAVVRNNRGDRYAFPKGAVLRRDAPIRLYSGKGTDTERTLFWGSDRGIWADDGDCVRVISPKGEEKLRQHWGRKEDDTCAPSKRSW